MGHFNEEFGLTVEIISILITLVQPKLAKGVIYYFDQTKTWGGGIS
jgi:hypothetical protein